MSREREPQPQINTHVKERLAIIEQSMKKLDDEAAAELIIQAKKEIRTSTGWDENKVEDEVSKYIEGKRDPAL